MALPLVAAADPPPVLRIEAGGAPALHRTIIEHPNGQVLYTAGDDRTVRTWRRSDLRLLDVWRVGLDPDQPFEGMLYVVAISPDGKTLAVAGWTGKSFVGSFCVYLFDTSTGRRSGQICDLADAIGVLHFMRDNRHLAIGMMGTAGLRVVRFANGTAEHVAYDASYQDGILGLDSDQSGVLYSVGLDGWLRRYGTAATSGFALTGRTQLTQGAKPARVKVSPSGEFLAVGFFDGPAPVIYDKQVRQVGQLAPPGTKGLRNLTGIAWSKDGRSLYTSGDPDSGAARIYRYELGRAEPVERIEVGHQRFFDLISLSDGSIAFTLEEARIGIVSETRAVLKSAVNGIVAYQRGETGIRIAPDGKTIAVPLPDMTELLFDASAARALPPADYRRNTWLRRVEAPSWLQWEPRAQSYRVDGQLHRLQGHDNLWTAAQGRRDTALLGTEWALVEVTREAQPRTIARFTSVVRDVQYVESTDTAIVALSDGRIIWVRRADGAELLTLFVHASTKEWVAWTPDGYYASSPHGDEMIGWTVTRGVDKEADFYRAVQLERTFYRPEIVKRALVAGSQDLKERQVKFAEALRSVAPPAVRILNLRSVAKAQSGSALQLSVEGERRGPAMETIALFVDDIPVTPTASRTLSATEQAHIRREFIVPVLSSNGTIRVEISTRGSVGVAEAAVPQGQYARTGMVRGDLYVLAIGAKSFLGIPKDLREETSLPLDFPDADARGIASMLADHGGSAFQHVYTKVLDGVNANAATKAGILDAFAFLREVKPQDTVIVFLAAHGYAVNDGYFFTPEDIAVDDLCAVVLASQPDAMRINPVMHKHCAGRKLPADPSKSFLSWELLDGALSAIPGRRYVLVDTCQAGAVSDGADALALRKRSASSRFALMLATSGRQLSYEHRALGHGFFAHGLITGIDKKSGDLDKDGELTASELMRYSRQHVADMLKRFELKEGAQTPHFTGPDALMAHALAR